MLFKLTAIATIINSILLQVMCSAIAGFSSGESTQRDKMSMNQREMPVSHGLHERQNTHWKRQWAKGGRVPADDLLPMRIGLVQRNINDGALQLQKL